MIKFLVVGQQLRIVTPIVVSDTHNYQECEGNFSGEAWENVYKWAHFTMDEDTYDIPFFNDKIVPSQSLDLTAGTWKVYLTGTDYSPKDIALEDLEWTYTAPYWSASLNPCAQLVSCTAYGIDTAAHVKAGTTPNTIAVESNVIYVFNDSAVNQPAGNLHYNESASAITRITTSTELLLVEAAENAHPFPSITPDFSEVLAGEIEHALNLAYGVQEQAASGELDGATFTPEVSSAGTLSWTNDKGRQNPPPVNIKGPKGDQGFAGDDGAPGVSPIVSVRRNDDDDGAVISIQDAVSSTTADVFDGVPQVHVGPDEPEDPNVLVWINNYDQPVTVMGDMIKSTYDTHDKGEDIFDYVDSAAEDLEDEIGDKQDATDNTLETTDKTIVGAINEVNSALEDKQDVNNLVTAFQATPDNTHYPSEKLVKDALDQQSATIDEKSTVSVSATGTSEDEVQYITIDGVEKKLAGGGAARTVFRVFCNVGDTVTVTDGTTSESKTLSTGTYLDFEIPNLGTWTASCGTLRKTAQIDYYGMYYADLRAYVFGIKRNTAASGTGWERTDDSIGYTATASVGSTAGSSDFDDKPPYNGIARTTVAGTEDVMVRIPKFYIKRWIDSDGYEHRQISNKHLDGFTLHGAFKHNNSEQNYIYIGAYKTGGGHTSKSGVSPLANITRDAFRSGARAKGEGWSLIDPYAVSAVEWLYLIEFADNNSQAILGNGVSSGSASAVTGDCDSIPNLTGMVNASTTRNNTVYRGIEGFYGNVWEFTDGLNVNNGNYYVSKNQADFADDTSGNYTSLAYAGATNWNNSFINSLGFDENNPEIALPTVATGGSATSYYCDAAWSATGWRVAGRGGLWSDGSFDGLFALVVNSASSGAYSYYGSRLLYVP